MFQWLQIPSATTNTTTYPTAFTNTKYNMQVFFQTSSTSASAQMSGVIYCVQNKATTSAKFYGAQYLQATQYLDVLLLGT